MNSKSEQLQIHILLALIKEIKKAFLLPYSAIEKYVFIDRKDAVDKAIVAEENAPKISKETYYEEY